MAQGHDGSKHLCPIWVGYFLAGPFRMLLQNPYKILAPHVRPGMAVLDVGSAMGFFSIPMARMVGPGGTVVCIDVQPKMLDVLRRRAAGKGLFGQIETHISTDSSIGMEGRRDSFDFALAFAVLHEVEAPAGILAEIHQLLKPGAALLLAEPAKHVPLCDFERTVALAEQAGFVIADRPEIRLSHAAVLTRPAQE
jgi:2-polyprenyl-3-methyl-5-hydroxy-6-metoxy-1,4-benzoquinol methylase